MEWLFENWVIVLLFGGMAAMHLFGHGHGGKHGKGDKGGHGDRHGQGHSGHKDGTTTDEHKGADDRAPDATAGARTRPDET